VFRLSMTNIRRAPIHGQYRFHLAHESRIHRRGNAPHPLLPGFDGVFLHLYARSRGISIPPPSIPPSDPPTTVRSTGHVPPAARYRRYSPSALHLHHPAPANVGARSSAAGKPSHTHRWRICSTVRRLQPPPPAPPLLGRSGRFRVRLRPPATTLGRDGDDRRPPPSLLHQPFQLLTLYPTQSHHITFLYG